MCRLLLWSKWIRILEEKLRLSKDPPHSSPLFANKWGITSILSMLHKNMRPPLIFQLTFPSTRTGQPLNKMSHFAQISGHNYYSNPWIRFPTHPCLPLAVPASGSGWENLCLHIPNQCKGWRNRLSVHTGPWDNN